MVVSDAPEYEERAISLVNRLQCTIAPLESGSTTVPRESGVLSDPRWCIGTVCLHLRPADRRGTRESICGSRRCWVDGHDWEGDDRAGLTVVDGSIDEVWTEGSHNRL